VEKGEVIFKFEVLCPYPQARRAYLTVKVPVVDGRPRRGLLFEGANKKSYLLTEEALKNYLGIRPWQVMKRNPDVMRAQIDRTEVSDYPAAASTRFEWY
jgi:hypothetical protein